MANSETISVRNGQLREKVEEFKDEAGYEHRSEAVEDLIRTGLRESRSPILTRFREKAINYANLMAVFALVFLAGGVVTEEISYATGLKMALVLVLTAIGIVSFVEVMRVLHGQSQLGKSVQGWMP